MYEPKDQKKDEILHEIKIVIIFFRRGVRVDFENTKLSREKTS